MSAASGAPLTSEARYSFKFKGAVSPKDVEDQILAISKASASRDKFLSVAVQTPSGPVLSLNPLLLDWYDPAKEGCAFYKTLLLDPEQRAEVAKSIRKRMSEELTWWLFTGIPSEPRKATSEEVEIYQNALKDEKFAANETHTQRKIREVYGLYCSVKEVPGVVHFDDFAAAPQKVDTGVPMGNNATGNAGIPTAAWWPWFMGSFSEEEPTAEVELEQKEKPVRFAREALPMMRKQQINRASAKSYFETHKAECVRLHKESLATLQRHALLLSCASAALRPEVKESIKQNGGDPELFFGIENAILANCEFVK